MWISKKEYDELRLQNSQLRGENLILHQRQTATDTTIDWFRVRVTQLEMERAQLLFNYTGVKVPTPVINRTEPAPEHVNPMTQMPTFEDMGDEEAARQNVGWNYDGTLDYGTKPSDTKQ